MPIPLATLVGVTPSDPALWVSDESWAHSRKFSPRLSASKPAVVLRSVWAPIPTAE